MWGLVGFGVCCVLRVDPKLLTEPRGALTHTGGCYCCCAALQDVGRDRPLSEVA